MIFVIKKKWKGIVSLNIEYLTLCHQFNEKLVTVRCYGLVEGVGEKSDL